MLGPHDEEDDFESTCVEEHEPMESEVEPGLAFLKGITPNESPFENLEEGDPMSSLEDDIGDYFHIEKEKWEIIGPQFDYAPIYDTNKEDEAEMGLPFLSAIICDDMSIDTPRKENYYFPLHEEGQLEAIDFPFGKDSIFNTNNDEINKAITYPAYDYVFKSLEPLDYDF